MGDCFRKRAGNPQLLMKHSLVRACQLGDSDAARPHSSAWRAGVKPLDRRFHHAPAAGGVDVHQIGADTGEPFHRLFHRIWDVMQF